MRIILVCLGILFLQSCARLKYESFLASEKNKMKHECIQVEKQTEKLCSSLATDNIHKFRKQIER